MVRRVHVRGGLQTRKTQKGRKKVHVKGYAYTARTGKSKNAGWKGGHRTYIKGGERHAYDMKKHGRSMCVSLRNPTDKYLYPLTDGVYSLYNP